MLALDAINPQVAARLMTAFRSWRALEPERRGNWAEFEPLVNGLALLQESKEK